MGLLRKQLNGQNRSLQQNTLHKYVVYYYCSCKPGAYHYQPCLENVPHHGIACHHDDVIQWKHFPRYWSFVRGIHRSPVNSPHKGQWRGALMFSMICAWRNSWANNRDAGDLRHHRANHDVTVMCKACLPLFVYARYLFAWEVVPVYL